MSFDETHAGARLLSLPVALCARDILSRSFLTPSVSDIQNIPPGPRSGAPSVNVRTNKILSNLYDNFVLIRRRRRAVDFLSYQL